MSRMSCTVKQLPAGKGKEGLTADGQIPKLPTGRSPEMASDYYLVTQ